MEEFREFLLRWLDDQLIQMIISGPRGEAGAGRIRVRPVEIKGKLQFQVTRTVGSKELHENFEREQAADAAGTQPGTGTGSGK